MNEEILKDLIVKNNTKIVLVVMDGLGGLPQEEGGLSELGSANTPNLDKLAFKSTCGLMYPIAPGITPGSGPAHLSLFGYDPIKYNIGRGVLSALGINFDVRKGDLCARINFATIDKEGKITDRRAGRISTEKNRELCKKLKENIKIPEGLEFFIETEKEHRACLVLRGKDLSERIADTDPQHEGMKPLDPRAEEEGARRTAEILKNIVEQVKEILRGEEKANMVLLRGFAQFHLYPTIEERFGLKAFAIASYPMYRGLAKLVGMELAPQTQTEEEEIEMLKENFSKYDYFFIHFKKTDSYGEDGNFEEKKKVIEKVDKLMPRIMDLKPDVLIVTCDHSTPARLKSHSWHPIPAMLFSKYVREDKIKKFDEFNCRQGSLSGLQSVELMPLALANALRLNKFGA
ncbi:MAG: 2,3-bisphosphoglycerate-independent phosphoglycerate mutase [Candidatus Omnitrophota bacterium]